MIKNRLKKFIKRLFVFTGIGSVICVISYFAILHFVPFPYEAIKDIGYSRTILDKEGNLLRAFLGKGDRWLLPVSLEEINPNFINATIAIEDKRFRTHFGVDIQAVMRSVKLNLTNQRVISGASTLSMQVIRILEGRERTFFNKIVETVHAIRLERLYTKDEILKLYFELAPYGGNIHGVKAASLRYFKKLPKDLNLSECALLAGLPQSPTRFRPDRYPQRAKDRRDRVLASMLESEFISTEQYELSKTEPVIAGNYPSPFKSPHFTRFVMNNSKEQATVTSLDPDLQHFAEVALKDMVGNLESQGVSNGAIVIIENGSGKVRAMVGSVDFFSDENSGQINGALSKRCPGSALKPFTYAIGFDKGLYTPSVVLADVPVQYNGYMPLDYDKKFRGPVSVREALVDSLNIPVVEVLDKVGYQNLYTFLKKSGITTLTKSPSHYGLALTLGSGDVNLLELTNAYASLARSGIFKPYSFIEEEDVGEGKQVISEGAAFLVSDILSDSNRFEAVGVHHDKTDPKFAFKTGTSYGNRDAWTIGYNPEYTIGVWLGNFSGKPSKALVGLSSAAPVVNRIFDYVYAKRSAPWFEQPESVGERYVCALDGRPATELSPVVVKDFFIKGVSISASSDMHRRIAIDKETGLALDEQSKEGREYTEEVFEVWPVKLQAWAKQHQSNYKEPPQYLKRDNRIVNLDKNRPKIVSPSHGCEYFTMNNAEDQDKLALLADGSFDSDELFWFVDDKFYKKSDIGKKIFWNMQRGDHKITAVDSYGRSSFVKIVVR